MRHVTITTAEHEQAARDYRRAALDCAHTRNDDMATYYMYKAREYQPPADSSPTAEFEIVVDFS